MTPPPGHASSSRAADVRNGTGGPSHCQRTGPERLGDTPPCVSPRSGCERLVVPLDPPFPAAWDPIPRRSFAATIVRVETDEGVSGIGSGDTMDGFEAFEHLFIGQDPLAIARHVRTSRRSTSTPAGTGRSRSRCGTSSARSPGCPVATLFGGARTASPPTPRAGCCCRPRSGPSRPCACARRGSGAQDPGRSAPARGRARRGGRDARRGRRLDGDHGRPQPGLADGRRPVRLARSGRRPRDRGTARRDGVLWLEEPLAGTDLRGSGRAAGVGARGPDRRRRDDPDVQRARSPPSRRTRSTSTSPTSS